MEASATKSPSVCKKLSINDLRFSVSDVNLKLALLCRTMFQELMLISLLGWFSVIVEHTYFYVLKQEGESSYLNGRGFPLAFIIGNIIVRVFERRIHHEYCSLMGFQYTETSAGYRVLQKIGVVTTLIAINWISLAVTGAAEKDNVEIMDALAYNHGFGSFSWGILMLYQNFAAKFLGTFVMIAFTRLYIDMAVYAILLTFYYPLDSKAKDDEDIPCATKVGSISSLRENNNKKTKETIRKTSADKYSESEN